MARVLLVDDQEEIRDMMGDFLLLLGHEFVEAADGEVAWQLFQRQSFDLVLTDMLMPQADGAYLLGQVRGVDDETPIIIMSGYLGGTTIEELREKGEFTFLPKPIILNQLQKTINHLLG